MPNRAHRGPFAVAALCWRAKKGHGKSIRRLAMTSILKRDSRASRPPDGYVPILSACMSKALEPIFRRLPRLLAPPSSRFKELGGPENGTAQRNALPQ
jgi:hypothetical protein